MWLINSLHLSTGTPRCTRRLGTGTRGWLEFWSARDVMPPSRTRCPSPNSYHASFPPHFSVGRNYLDTFFCLEKLGSSKLPFRLAQIGETAIVVGSFEPLNPPLLLLLFWREITQGVLASARKRSIGHINVEIRPSWLDDGRYRLPWDVISLPATPSTLTPLPSYPTTAEEK